nr:uncharacterized protein CTRU02_05557 [Colletotrichum truncatum]KAF6794000.1 hypothetical protein CTRU02_05557 [Colletotrichum truncatum]
MPRHLLIVQDIHPSPVYSFKHTYASLLITPSNLSPPYCTVPDYIYPSMVLNMGNDSPSLVDEPTISAGSTLSTCFQPTQLEGHIRVPETPSGDEECLQGPCRCFDCTLALSLPSTAFVSGGMVDSAVSSPFAGYFPQHYNMGFIELSTNSSDMDSLPKSIEDMVPINSSQGTTEMIEAIEAIETTDTASTIIPSSILADDSKPVKRRRTKPTPKAKSFCRNCVCSSCLSESAALIAKSKRRTVRNKSEV